MDAAGTVGSTYSPNSCGQASIRDDGNWVTIDLTAQAGGPLSNLPVDSSGTPGFM